MTRGAVTDTRISSLWILQIWLKSDKEENSSVTIDRLIESARFFSVKHIDNTTSYSTCTWRDFRGTWNSSLNRLERRHVVHVQVSRGFRQAMSIELDMNTVLHPQ